jgi:hypothetical protein
MPKSNPATDKPPPLSDQDRRDRLRSRRSFSVTPAGRDHIRGMRKFCAAGGGARKSGAVWAFRPRNPRHPDLVPVLQ